MEIIYSGLGYLLYGIAALVWLYVLLIVAAIGAAVFVAVLDI